MSTFFASAAVVNSSSSFAYRGNGYRYWLHTKGPQGTRVSLQAPKALLQEFEAKVGRCNSLGIPGLQVFQSNGGWWTITVMYEHLAHLVTRFLARLNRWVLTKKLAALSVSSIPKARKYVVLVPEIKHPKAYKPTPLPTRDPGFVDKVFSLAMKFKPHHAGAH